MIKNVLRQVLILLRKLLKITLIILIAESTISQIYCQNINISEQSPINEPYPYVNFGSYSDKTVAGSPDPLVSYRWVNPQAKDGLQIYILKPIKVTSDNSSSFSNLNSLIGNKPDVSVTGTGSITFDFGCENAAWLEFDSPDLIDSESVTMSISEYNEPAIICKEATNPVKTKIPTKYGITYRLELNKELYEGVRFGWIHVNNFSKPWHISDLRLVCQIKPTNYNGSFSCSDSLLTRIWYTGAYTVKLNLLKDYFGAILMDRSDRFSWTGDAHPAQAASMVAFGNYGFVKTNIENTALQDNGIASYALYWVLSLIDYYNYTGDKSILNKYLDNACSKLDAAYRNYGTDPNIGFYGWDERLGAGFENPNSREPENAYKMLSIRAWRDFSETMKEYRRFDLYEKYKKYANTKIKELRQNNDWYNSFGLHAAADAINAGVTTKEEQRIFYTKEFSDRVNRLSFSPFNQYFIIQAMSDMGRYDAALSCVEDLWGGQIKYGGTTFLEVYRPSWNKILNKNDAPIDGQSGFTSLCHPWSAGVTKWLTEEILGIKPTSPGFSTYVIIPHLGETLTSVEGKVLTPHGNIYASFNVKNGQCNIITPIETLGEVGIPKVKKKIVSIQINGQLAWENNKYIKVKDISAAHEDNDFVYLTGVKPGRYDFSVLYSGKTPVYKELPWKYSVNNIKEDSTTRGNWGGVYGSSGFILCSYIGSTLDLKRLPSYVSSVCYGRKINRLWATGVSDKRAPASDAHNNFPRNIGCFHTNDGVNGDQTMTIDITIKHQQTFRVALYFVDWDNAGRRTAVEMFDLQTKKLVAPVKMVKNYSGGKYIVFEYNKSVRFRVNQVRGVEAVLSGIFFD